VFLLLLALCVVPFAFAIRRNQKVHTADTKLGLWPQTTTTANRQSTIDQQKKERNCVTTSSSSLTNAILLLCH